MKGNFTQLTFVVYVKVECECFDYLKTASVVNCINRFMEIVHNYDPNKLLTIRATRLVS